MEMENLDKALVKTNALGIEFMCYLDPLASPLCSISSSVFLFLKPLPPWSTLLNRSEEWVAQGDSGWQMPLLGCSRSAVPVSCPTSLSEKRIPSLVLACHRKARIQGLESTNGRVRMISVPFFWFSCESKSVLFSVNVVVSKIECADALY